MLQRKRFTASMLSLVIAAATLTGCASEDTPHAEKPVLTPGSIGGVERPSTSDDSKKPAPEFEGEDPEVTPDTSGRQPIDEPKQHELPASFPTDRFVIPDTYAVYDAGERMSGGWFVVLSVASHGEAATVFRDIVAKSGLSIEQEETGADGSYIALARSHDSSLEALSTSEQNGQVLLSIDAERFG